MGLGVGVHFQHLRFPIPGLDLIAAETRVASLLPGGWDGPGTLEIGQAAETLTFDFLRALTMLMLAQQSVSSQRGAWVSCPKPLCEALCC